MQAIHLTKITVTQYFVLYFPVIRVYENVTNSNKVLDLLPVIEKLQGVYVNEGINRKDSTGKVLD